jgi:hypothetical protein
MRFSMICVQSFGLRKLNKREKGCADAITLYVKLNGIDELDVFKTLFFCN